MRFRRATEDDSPRMRDFIGDGERRLNLIIEAFVTDNEEGQRYWVVARPFAFGQIRLQLWHERRREEQWPQIFHDL